jgi:predicted dehydrogenase
VSGKLRVGVVGAGWWAVANHLPLLKSRPDVELVGACRLGQAELARVQSMFDIPYGAEDFAAMLDEAPMDALVVASPHNLHGAQAMAALEKGLHVLIEKPMTVAAGEARAIAALARDKGRHVLVPYGWNFKPFFAEARALVSRGRIGRIRHVSAQMASPIGDLMTGSDLAGTEHEVFRPDPDTWANPRTGGCGWGQLVHLLGGLFYVTDLVPREVVAFVGRAELGADLYNAAAVRFTNEATGTLSGSATVPTGSRFQVDIRLFGDAGMLLLDVERERLVLRRNDRDDLDVSIPAGDGDYACVEPVNRFIDLCLGRDVVNCGDASVGLRSVEVVEAMLRSARSGRVERTGDPNAKEDRR